MTIPRVSPLEAKQRLDLGFAMLVDIREADEYAREHVDGSHSVPLSQFDTYDLRADRTHPTVIFLCQNGNVACIHYRRLATAACRECYVMAGGLMGWKAAGLPTNLDRNRPIEIRRQAMVANGAIVLLGLLLVSTLSPWFIVAPVVAACEIVLAGMTGWSAMAKLLAWMPWNRSVR